MRVLYVTLGWLSVALGLLGALLPLLPATPFLLLAAACFARSSDRARDWLLGHPRLGPPIADWKAGGVIRRPAKRAAMLAVAASLGASLALGVAPWALALQALCLTAVSAFILTRPGAAAPAAAPERAGLTASPE